MSYYSHAQEGNYLHLNNSPILNVFIEGPDGAGKTTILDFLSKRYSSITLPKSGEIGLLPNDKDQLISWFQTSDPFVTARLYLLSHQKRFEYIRNYSKRGHYKLINVQRGNKPTLILADRGPLSARAYAYSSIRLNSNISDGIIEEFIAQQFNYYPKIEQSIYIICYPDISKSKNLLYRIKNVPDKDRELKLIEGQIKYYNNNKHNLIKENYINLDPFTNLEINLNRVEEFVDQAMQIMVSKERNKFKQTNIKRVHLAEIIEKVLSFERQGDIAIIGGLVEKGYTDNDIDIIFNDIKDENNLRKIIDPVHPNLHIYPAQGNITTISNYKIIIKPTD